MIVAIALALVVVGIIFYIISENVYNKSRGNLVNKYQNLVSLLLLTNARLRLLKKSNNILVLGLLELSGKTFFTIKEIQKNSDVDVVPIVYSIKDNPTYKDFDLRFLYSESICLNDPKFVLSSINQRIKEFLISQHI
jgi:hypothetical protein